ncbi:MAG: hypothetical protein AAB431_04225, partial [Patescibacteria group bacterium]
MKYPSVFKQIQTKYAARELLRREIIGKANDAIGRSKRAIFALHREDAKGAQELLDGAQSLFVECERLFKRVPDLSEEGSYRAALEEYAEACLFSGYLKNGSLGAIEDRVMDPLVYLAGLADATGEIVRYTVRQVTLGKTKEVAHARETVEMVIEYMLSLDGTGYLRTKFDQAKGNLKRLEDISYDLS